MNGADFSQLLQLAGGVVTLGSAFLAYLAKRDAKRARKSAASAQHSASGARAAAENTSSAAAAMPAMQFTVDPDDIPMEGVVFALRYMDKRISELERKPGKHESDS